MPTARLLPVSPSMHCSGGLYLPGGVPAQGVYLPGGVPGQGRGVYLPEGVSAQGGVGCTCPGGVPAGGYT